MNGTSSISAGKNALFIGFLLLWGMVMQGHSQKSEEGSDSKGTDTASAEGSKKDSANKAFGKDQKLISTALSFGDFDRYDRRGDQDLEFIPLSISYEHGIHDYVGFGAFLGYARWEYEFERGPPPDKERVEYDLNVVSFGVKGTFHYLQLMTDEGDFSIDSSKWDFYTSLFLGYDLRTLKDHDHDSDLEEDSEWVSNAAIQFGFRYYPSSNFGIFVEGGRGIMGVMRVGGTFKL